MPDHEDSMQEQEKQTQKRIYDLCVIFRELMPFYIENC